MPEDDGTFLFYVFCSSVSNFPLPCLTLNMTDGFLHIQLFSCLETYFIAVLKLVILQQDYAEMDGSIYIHIYIYT